MTWPVAVRRVRPIAPRPLTAAERKHAAAICRDPRLLNELEQARVSVALTPAAISARDLEKTLYDLAAKLDAASNALVAMPHTAAALLQEQTLQPQAMPERLGMLLLDLSIKARVTARRVNKPAGRPPDQRLLEAVRAADDLRKRFAVHSINAPELASLILGAQISADAYRRARQHLRRKPP